MRLGSTGEPFRWYISQPAKCGPLTSHFSRLPSDVRTNAPLRVPTSTRTLLIFYSFRVSRLDRYPYFDISHSGSRVKLFAIAFEEVRCAGSRPGKFMAGRR